MATEEKVKGIGDILIDSGKSVMDFMESVVGSEAMGMGMDWWKSEQGKKAIEDFNAHAQKIAKEGNDLKEKWVKKSRGYDTSDPEGNRSGYFYNPAVVIANGDGTFGVDKNGDGTVNESFATQAEAQARVEEIGGTTSFETYGGEGLYSREVEDVVLANQNQIRKVVQQLETPEERKALLDAIAKFADLQSERTSTFITSALIDEDIEEDGVKVESLSKARTELVNSLNAILGDTADAINLADSIGTGEINKADFRRAVDVGDALNDQAESVSDQEYYRAMAVVAANEDKYDLLSASAKEARLDIYNDLQAERYKGGFQGLSSRHTRDLAREFLANNTVLAKQLSDINIENAKILGDAHVRRARLEGEAAVKSSQMQGDANVRGEERLRKSGVEQAQREGAADATAAGNLIKNKDYITNIRDKLKFEGYQQELYEMDRIAERDKALASGVETEQDMLAEYRVGPANFGDPDIAEQMHHPEFDWLSNLLDRITKSEGAEKDGLIESMLAGIKSGFAGIASGIGSIFGGDDEETVTYKTGDNGNLVGSNGETIVVGGDTGTTTDDDSNTTGDGGGVVMNPSLPPGAILDDDGNGVDDRTDMNGDGVINEQDTLFYEPDSGKYYQINPVNGGREYLDGSDTGFFDDDGNPLSETVPGTEGVDTDGDGVIDSFSIKGINEEGFFESEEDKVEREVDDFVEDLYAGQNGVNPENQNTGENYPYAPTTGSLPNLETGKVVRWNADAGYFEVTDAEGKIQVYTKEEMDELGVAIPEEELALYEATTGDFQMSDEELGLDFGGLDLELGGLGDLGEQSSNFLSESQNLGLTPVEIAGGGAVNAFNNSGGAGTAAGNIQNQGQGDGSFGGTEEDLGYGLNPLTGEAYTHDEYTAANGQLGGQNEFDLGGGDLGLGDFDTDFDFDWE